MVLEELADFVQDRMKKNNSDHAHDFDHVMRVYANAMKISRKEKKSNAKLVLCAALLHDIVSYPKSGKLSKASSAKSALEAKRILKKFNFSPKEAKVITDAIRDHSFSRGRTPQTLEGKILQDADRLDALGAIGIARTFTVGGAENRPIYNRGDPFCSDRKINDKGWTVDHFYKKLLFLQDHMHTRPAKIEARHRTKIIKKFLTDLKKEV